MARALDGVDDAQQTISLSRRTTDIACDLAQVSRKKVDGVVCEEHVTGRPGHHHPTEGGGGQDEPRVRLTDSLSQQVEEDDYL